MKWMVVPLIVLLTPSLFGQIEPDPASQDSIPPPESIIPSGMVAERVDTVTKFQPAKSPGLAMLFSALVPGAGQAYNESYWKVPVVMGFGVYFASMWLHNNRLYHDYRDKYLASFSDPQTPNGNTNFQRIREFYRDQRDTFTWYFFILYLLNVADAYVDASLYDFNVGDDLSIRMKPEEGTRLSLQLRF